MLNNDNHFERMARWISMRMKPTKRLDWASASFQTNFWHAVKWYWITHLGWFPDIVNSIQTSGPTQIPQHLFQAKKTKQITIVGTPCQYQCVFSPIMSLLVQPWCNWIASPKTWLQLNWREGFTSYMSMHDCSHCSLRDTRESLAVKGVAYSFRPKLN